VAVGTVETVSCMTAGGVMSGFGTVKTVSCIAAGSMRIGFWNSTNCELYSNTQCDERLLEQYKL